MEKLYVYLIKTEKRLVITNKEFNDSDHVELMNGSNRDLCNCICIGYLIGQNQKIKVVNEINEFL